MNRESSEEVQGSRKQERPAVYEWKGRPAIVGYTGGPYPSGVFDIERGSLEARSGLFLLTEVSDLGIMARKLVKAKKDEGEGEEAKLDDPIFIPWASVHSIRVVKSANESSE